LTPVIELSGALFQFALKTTIILPDVGAALAAMYFSFAAKAAPTNTSLLNENWN
jgi:hypothetical protein